MSKLSLKRIFYIFILFIFIIFLLTFLSEFHLLLGVLLIIGIIFIVEKFDIKHFTLYLVIISFLVRLASLFIFNVPQTSDFAVLLDAAKKFAINDYSFSKDAYFTMWAYQTGFVIYEGLILKLFSNTFFLKLLNITYEVIINLFIYKISLKLVSKKSSKIVSLLYAILPFSLYYGTVLCNNHLSSLLFIIAIYLLLYKDSKIFIYIVSGILLSLGNTIRCEGVVVIFSYLLYKALNINKKNIKDTFKFSSILLITYLLCNIGTSYLIQSLNINSEGLKNNNPLWKFVLGTNASTSGMYDTNDEVNLSDYNKELEVIKERINSPLKIINLIEKKTYKFILTNDLLSTSDIYNDKIINIGPLNLSFTFVENIVNGTNKVIYLFILISLIVGTITKKKDIISCTAFYYLIFFIVNYVVYMLIEIHPRYTYYMLINMFILAGFGIDTIYSKIIRDRSAKR